MITIQTQDGTLDLEPIDVYGDFAMHHVELASGTDEETYNITHIPSGLCITYRKYKDGVEVWRNPEECSTLMRCLADVLKPGDISFGDDGQWRATSDARRKWFNLRDHTHHDVEFIPYE
jgi:hypothetical protein